VAFQVPDISDESAASLIIIWRLQKWCRLSVNKQLVPEFDIESVNVKRVDYVAVAEQCQVKYYIGLHCM
jgi:hypothetical protein